MNDDLPAIDAFSRHEVLHVASIAADFFERHLLEHRVVRDDPHLRTMAEAISEKLWAFYQAAGQSNLERDELTGAEKDRNQDAS